MFFVVGPNPEYNIFFFKKKKEIFFGQIFLFGLITTIKMPLFLVSLFGSSIDVQCCLLVYK